MVFNFVIQIKFMFFVILIIIVVVNHSKFIFRIIDSRKF